MSCEAMASAVDAAVQISAHSWVAGAKNVPKQDSDGNPSEPDMARRDPTSPDGSLDCPVSVYD